MRVLVGGVTAVVVTYDSAAVIGDCLASLAAHAPGVPVIVVDNASHDDTCAIVARVAPWAELVASGRNGGYAAAINVGARRATPGHDLLVLNPDARVAEGCVEALTAAGTETSTGIVAPRIVHPDGTTAFSLRREPTLLRALGEALLGGERAGRREALGEIVARPEPYQRPGVVDWASGAALLVKRTCHDELGGWDESFFLYAEETDLCLRAADFGWKTRYAPDATVMHIGGHGERTALRELMLVNRAVLYQRRHGRVRGVAFRGALALNELLRAGRSPHHRAALRRLLGFPSRLGLPSSVNP